MKNRAPGKESKKGSEAKDKKPGHEEPGVNFLLKEEGAAVGKVHLATIWRKTLGGGTHRVKSV